MPSDPGRSRYATGAAEALLVAIACLTPWAFGAVEPWALTLVDAAVLGLAALGLARRGSEGPGGARWPCLPGIALLGLSLLGFFQGFAEVRAPSTIASPRVAGDPSPAVPPPPGTLSRTPEETRDVAWRLASAWVVLGSTIALRGGPAWPRALARAVVVNACALSLFAMVQALTWNGRIYWVRTSPQEGAWFAGGPFVCHSHLAAYLNLGLGFALGSLVEARGKAPRLWTAYAAALIAAGVVASRSRSGVVAMVGALIALVILNPRLLRLAAAGSAVAALGGLLMLALPGGEALGRLATLFDPGSRGYSARLEIWGQALEAWKASPTWGWGLGGFGAAVAPFGVRDRGVYFSRAENEYLDLLVEGGAVGLGIGLAGLVGLAILARRAMRLEGPSRNGGIVMGAAFGLVALAIQSLGDFAPHIPAVGLAATVVAGLACRAGLEAGASARRPDSAIPGRFRLALGAGLPIALAVGVLAHDLPRFRAQLAMAGSDLPTPGISSPDLRPARVPKEDLERRLAALDAMLRHRPGWAEGHLRRGITLVALYEREAAEAIEAETGDPARAERLGDVLTLRSVMHPRQGAPSTTTAGLIEHEPVRRFLVPAARSFLEARRRGELVAQAHAGLASLDFLLEGDEPPGTHARRADELAGANRRVRLILAEVATQDGDLDQVARSLRGALRAGDLGWEAIADRALELFGPDRILRDVLPEGGRFPLLFAGRLEGRAWAREARSKFLEAALERLPGDPDLTPPERLQVEALARAAQGDRRLALERMEAALALEPSNGEWRQDLGRWLLEDGRAEDAHRQALIGLQLRPDHAGLARLRDDAAEARARGE